MCSLILPFGGMHNAISLFMFFHNEPVCDSMPSLFKKCADGSCVSTYDGCGE